MGLLLWTELVFVATAKEPVFRTEANISGIVRVICVPRSEPIVLRNLGARTAHTPTYFDPVSGAKSALGTVHADADGSWTCAPPAGPDHDWLLILEAKTKKGAAPRGERKTRVSEPVHILVDSKFSE